MGDVIGFEPRKKKDAEPEYTGERCFVCIRCESTRWYLLLGGELMCCGCHDVLSHSRHDIPTPNI